MKKITKITFIAAASIAFAASLFAAGTADAHDNPPPRHYEQEEHRPPHPEPKHHDDHREGPEHHK